MNNEQVKHMVDRFLGWKLPRDHFNPDCGISFDKKPFNTHTPHPSQYEPVGTNLFDATQADAMVRHMIEGLPRGDEFAWLIEAPGPRYLAGRKVGSLHEFVWHEDHLFAIRFRSREQADLTMMAIRQLAPDLFGFERTLGVANAVEHGWMAQR